MWAAIFDGETWRRLVRDPIAWGSFLVGLAPLFGVLTLGWTLSTVVVLYWLENVVIGALALLRLIGAGLMGKMMPPAGANQEAFDQVERFVKPIEWPLRLGGTAFLSSFFVVHYGMFCFVHGLFVLNLFSPSGAGAAVEDTPMALLTAALASGQGIVWVLAAIAAWKFLLFVVFFIGRGDVRASSLSNEMIAPYGRIIALHVAIFAGAFGLMLLGQPIVGVLALALIKALHDAGHDWAATRMKVPPSPPAQKPT